MKNKIIYSFQSNKNYLQLESLSSHIFLFGALKKDISDFFKIIDSTKPDLITGIGNSSNFVIEGVAVNKFNKNGKISKSGKEFYDLYLPEQFTDIAPVSSKQTVSFCNWTAYKISEYIDKNNLTTKNSLIHSPRHQMSYVIQTLFNYF